MFCLLVVLVERNCSTCQVVKWLARKTRLKKPNRGDGIVFRKPRQKSAYDFLGFLYCFIVLLCICVVSCPYVIFFPTNEKVAMQRQRLFVLEVQLNPKQTDYRIMGCLEIPPAGRELRMGWRTLGIYGAYQANICAGVINLLLQMCVNESKWSNIRRRPGPRYQELTALPRPVTGQRGKWKEKEGREWGWNGKRGEGRKQVGDI